MQFLNPAVLFGLLAAGIPILLHFLSRRQVIQIDFAPLRFLRPTQERQMRRMSLRRLLLLLIRIAIVVSVVLAAARPTLTGNLAGIMGAGDGASAVLLVDVSASMSAQTSGGILFDRARDEAVRIAREFDRKDEIAVLLFSDVTRPLFAEFVRDAGLIEAELAQATPGARRGDYIDALSGALEFLERSQRARREIYVISDFQRATIDSVQQRAWRNLADAAPPTAVYLRPIEIDPFVNRQVDLIASPTTLLRVGETTEIVARLRQDGEETQQVPLFLELEGTPVGETELELSPRGSAQHRFPLTLPSAGDVGASIRLRPDRYGLDDESFFVLPVNDQVPVMVLRGLTGEEGARDPLLFLLAALDPDGEGEGRFATSVSLASRFDVEDLPRSPVVIGMDLRDLGAARLDALGDYLEAGGTMLLFVGDPRVRTYTNERLLPGWTRLRLGRFRGEEDIHERLEIVAADHPIFEGLDQEARATLEEVRLRNFFRLDESIGRTLIRFAGGGAAVTEIEVGRGRVVICGFETSAVAGDLPFSPMFLPIVQRLTGYLATAGWGRFGRHFEVGEAPTVEVSDLPEVDTRWTIRWPDGQRAPATLDASIRPARLSASPAEQAGLAYFERDGAVLATVAINVPRTESERIWWSTAKFIDTYAVEDGALRFAALEGNSTAEAVAAARNGRPIHLWLLIAAGLLLIAESMLARRLGPTPAA